MIKLGPFGGIVPKLGVRLLQDGFAQAATNIKLQSGEIRPINGLGTAYVPASPKSAAPQSIFRARNGTSSAVWLTWDDDADCVRVPLATDVESRFCWTGDGVPKLAKYTGAIAGGGSNYPVVAGTFALGIPTPVTAPTVVPSATGTGSSVTRFYRYTFVSQDGEESSPSPVSAIATGKLDDTWAISTIDTVPLNTGTVSSTTRAGDNITAVTSARNWLRVGDEVTVAGVTTMTEANGTFTVTAVATNGLSFTYAVTAAATGTPGGAGTWTRPVPWNTTSMVKRLYRTTGSTGSWQLVNDTGIAAATTTYNDTLTDANIAGDEMISDGWVPPPVGLTCLAVHPSGALVGLVGNLLCFSEPYQPHAWPEAYQLASGYNGVGLALFGTTVVMATAGMPFVATGVEPASMSGEDVQGMYPCLSKRSVLSIGTAVLYASKHGAVMVGAQGISMFTEPFFTRDEWDGLNPDSMVFEAANGRVYVGYEPDSGVRKVLVFDGQMLTDLAIDCQELYADPATGDLYVADATGIRLFDDPTEVVLTGNWKSKEYVFPAPVNLGAAKIDYVVAVSASQQAAQLAAIAAATATNTAILLAGNANGSLNSSQINEKVLHGSDLVDVPSAPATNTITFNLYTGDTLKVSRVVDSTRAFRLPAGYKADAYSIEIISQCEIKEIRVAETTDALRKA